MKTTGFLVRLRMLLMNILRSALTGHSRGGDFASRCFLDHPVWRIMWNGFRTGSEKEHLNLVTKNDPLTKLFEPKNKVVICDGDHIIYDFKDKIKRLSWVEIVSLKVRAIQEPHLRS